MNNDPLINRPVGNKSGNHEAPPAADAPKHEVKGHRVVEAPPGVILPPPAV